ncbi:unnamed protein product, partial [marine sediment metagenome]
QFYDKLVHSKILPVTSVPSPASFAEAYDRLAEDTDEILAITLTSKLSGTYEVALQSIGLMKRKCRVEVVDSQWAVMAKNLHLLFILRRQYNCSEADHPELPQPEVEDAVHEY